MHEAEMERKNGMNNDIMVSVICMVYNEEAFIGQCLDSLVNQKTNFKYEILVHDDASTDGSARIIREYAARYPQLIKPTFQVENQYSKGVSILKSILLPSAKGKYFAYCEGDDYWTSEHKLQRQVDFLEKNPDYSACYSSYSKVDINGRVLKNVFFEEGTTYRFEDTLSKPMPQTATCIIRAAVERSIPDFCFGLGVGDIRRFNWAGYCGNISIISDIMSCYRQGNAHSWTVNMKKNKQKRKNNLEKAIQYYDAWDSFTEHRYHDILSLKADWSRLLLESENKNLRAVLKSPVYKEFSFKEKIVWLSEMYIPKILNFYRRKTNKPVHVK